MTKPNDNEDRFSREEFFTAEDFKGKGFIVPTDSNIFQELADIANAIIREALEKAPKVYRDEETTSVWVSYKDEFATHTAKLVAIEEILNKEEKSER